MSLQLRLTLAYALVLTLVLLGAGLTAYTLFARDLTQDFEEDLQRLALAYAEQTTADPLQLRPLPSSPIPEEIEDPSVYLFDRQGVLLQVIGEEKPVELPPAQIEKALAGQPVSFPIYTNETRPLWQVAFSTRPIPHERRAVLVLLGKAAEGHLLMVSASDLGTIRVLQRLRQTVLLWLGLGVGIALLAGYLIARVVTRPLREIAATAQKVEQGELQHRIPHDQGRDEIAQLKQRLNAMLVRLETLVDAQRRFTADAAHDLRTPLAVLKGDLDVTLRRERSALEYRESLERMRSEVNRMTRLAEDLLTLSRLEAGLSAPFDHFELRSALDTVLPAHARSAQQKGLELLTQIPAGLRVWGDPSLVARAVGNLLSNAIAHTERGQVGLVAEPHDGRVWLRVWDSGPGIAPELQHSIFLRFNKGERSKGAGLGLSIVAEVARVHQGKVQVKNRTSGGAEFSLDLPARTQG